MAVIEIEIALGAIGEAHFPSAKSWKKLRISVTKGLSTYVLAEYQPEKGEQLK